MNFSEWYKLQEDAGLAEYDWTMAAIQMGQTPDFPDHLWPMFQKLESMIGMQKFVKALPKAALAQALFALSVANFIRRPHDLEALKNVVARMSEALKMGVYSGATVPLGAVIGNAVVPGAGGFVGGILAKCISYGYFYMGQWAELNLENPKYAEWAKKIHDMMPKSMTKKPEEKKERGWFDRWLNRAKPSHPVF